MGNISQCISGATGTFASLINKTSGRPQSIMIKTRWKASLKESIDACLRSSLYMVARLP